jgi:predicted nucleic acid-binding protein
MHRRGWDSGRTRRLPGNFRKRGGRPITRRIMISLDTSILLSAVESRNKNHAKAAGFVTSLGGRDDVVISEFILVELYGLLRNPAVLEKPLTADAGVDTCEAFRQHPRWQVVGFSRNSRAFHDQFRPKLRAKDFARRRAYDWRVALLLLDLGVTEFVSVNEKDFQNFGFKRVWNPLKVG